MSSLGTISTETPKLTAAHLVELRDQGADRRFVLFENWQAAGENEMVLFLKPELIVLPEASLEIIVEMTLAKIREFGLAIESVSFLPSAYLKKHGVMDGHYGVINRLARSARASLSEEGREKFKQVYGVDVEAADLAGGVEFLERFPAFTAESLDQLWGETRSDKLAPGTYCRRLSMEGKEVFLINGFHPSQLLHFTAERRGILAMALRGDADWREARTSLIGATRPEDAVPGSLRAVLLARRDELGIQEISQGFNGVHLSAGPVEGLAELRRFGSDLSAGGLLPIAAFSFGKRLIEAFGEETAEHFLSNPTVELEGRSVSIFDLTEELNAGAAIERLKTLN